MAATKNVLLTGVRVTDWACIAPHLCDVDLPLGKVLVDREEVIHQVYFPSTGVISGICVFDDGRMAEIAAVGREGMAPMIAALGSSISVGRWIVQVPGSALAMKQRTFARVTREVPAFGAVVQVGQRCPAG